MKSSQQEECVLCCREITIYATGACDHPVCYECSTRMRVLCETNECPICRSDMPYVVFTYQIQNFSSIVKKFSLFNKEYNLIFEDKEIQVAFEILLENRCSSCEELMSTFDRLKEHVRRKHELHYCELCTDNLKIFTFERKCYSRKDLARHRRIGDPDNTSHRGHPLCEFCDQRYTDKDDLYRHLRRNHFFCHFCDADGKNQYYKDYEFLRVHFRMDHYLCEEDNCVNEQFIGAFRSEIDLKAHKAIHHSKNKTRAEAKQARMLDLEFSYNARNAGSSSPRGGRYGQNRKRNEENIFQDRNRISQQQPEVENFNTQSVQDFPYLSEDAVSKTSRPDNLVPEKQLNSLSLTQSYSRNPAPYRKNVMSVDDFPALSSSTVPITSETSNTQSRKINNSVSRQNVAPARTSSASVLFANKNVPTSEEKRLKNSELESSGRGNWLGKKVKPNFEEEFPTLETKKKPILMEVKRNPAQEIKKPVPVPISAPDPPTPSRYADTIITTNSSSADQFVIIKGKSKKKKQNQIYIPPEIDKNSDFSSQFLALHSETETQEDKFKKHMVHPLLASSGSNNHKENYTWSEEVSFRNDDFPPLAISEPVKKPPGFNAPKAKVPPPGFSENAPVKQSSIGNKTLSSIVREIVKPNKSDVNGVNESSGYISTEDSNNHASFIRPASFDRRNDELIRKIQDLANAQGPLFQEFKAISGRFRYDAISAAEYHTQCLEILGLNGFLEIFPELVSLLPDINKQQELLTVHNTFLSQQNGGAVSKKSAKNSNRVVSCDQCKQVLVIDDCKSHARNHSTNAVE